ncbi:hypothetical protein [Rosenbergiella epipactidis]|uniref:hypothetical protein n=1 Tax=Rosenbergiella epipactidis TaxID=1544694 RepID=UPI001F4DF183|nr:hypothetical protein [Rosenbergiella epipactidis]
MALIPEETIDRLYGEVSVALLDKKEKITLDSLLHAFQDKLSKETCREEALALKAILSSLHEIQNSHSEEIALSEIYAKKGRGLAGE